MEQINETVLVTKPAFRAVGLRWSGTFAEAGAGGIRAVQTELKSRLQEITNAIAPDLLLGLSYHARPDADGFTHYAVVEVEQSGIVPEGMELIEVPVLTYAKCEHRKGQIVNQSYRNIYAWIENQGYEIHDDAAGLTHFEIYPMAQNPYAKEEELEFVMMIPLKMKDITEESVPLA